MTSPHSGLKLSEMDGLYSVRVPKALILFIFLANSSGMILFHFINLPVGVSGVVTGEKSSRDEEMLVGVMGQSLLGLGIPESVMEPEMGRNSWIDEQDCMCNE